MIGGKAASNLQVPTYLLSYPTQPWYIEYGFGLTGEGEEEFTRFVVEERLDIANQFRFVSSSASVHSARCMWFRCMTRVCGDRERLHVCIALCYAMMNRVQNQARTCGHTPDFTLCCCCSPWITPCHLGHDSNHLSPIPIYPISYTIPSCAVFHLSVDFFPHVFLTP